MLKHKDISLVIYLYNYKVMSDITSNIVSYVFKRHLSHLFIIRHKDITVVDQWIIKIILSIELQQLY